MISGGQRASQMTGATHPSDPDAATAASAPASAYLSLLASGELADRVREYERTVDRARHLELTRLDRGRSWFAVEEPRVVPQGPGGGLIARMVSL